MKKFGAFLSYARADDSLNHITPFRERLGYEVSTYLGQDFPIFQDKKDILWGNQWRRSISEALEEVIFLIPILSPRFFNSPVCREEFDEFLAREKAQGRSDVILPVYFVDYAPLNNPEKADADPLVKEILRRNWEDWRELRFESTTSPQMARTYARLAIQIRDRLRLSPAPAAALTQLPTVQQAESTLEAAQPSKRSGPQTQIATHVVDMTGSGDFTTISEAMTAAEPGDRILIRPGLYGEGLVIEKSLELIGDGELDRIIVNATGKDAVLFKANLGRITNLTLRQEGGGEWYGVDITQGRLDLDGCDICSQSLAGVAIHGGADPVVRRNRIHDGKSAGVLVYENGRGTLEDNEIFTNEHVGIEIGMGGDPVVRRNRIHDGKSGGVLVCENGRGTLEDNDIFANRLSGMQIKESSDPVVRRNRIHDNNQSGVFANKKGRGTLEDNEIFANAFQGVTTADGARPIVRSNRILRNKQFGVRAHKAGGGTFEDNDVRENERGPKNISADSLPLVIWRNNTE